MKKQERVLYFKRTLSKSGGFFKKMQGYASECFSWLFSKGANGLGVPLGTAVVVFKDFSSFMEIIYCSGSVKYPSTYNVLKP